MQQIQLTTREGMQKAIEAETGISLMENIRNAGISDLEAACGGACVCGTCHVFVDAASFALLPPPSDAENDLLDSCSLRLPNSRLSCQIRVTGELSGLHVTIGPEY